VFLIFITCALTEYCVHGLRLSGIVMGWARLMPAQGLPEFEFELNLVTIEKALQHLSKKALQC
jgi:hypothetical protein